MKPLLATGLTASAGKLLSRYVALKLRLLKAGVIAAGAPNETPPLVDLAMKCWPWPVDRKTSYARYTLPAASTATCDPWTAPFCVAGLIWMALDQVTP